MDEAAIAGLSLHPYTPFPPLNTHTCASTSSLIAASWDVEGALASAASSTDSSRSIRALYKTPATCRGEGRGRGERGDRGGRRVSAPADTRGLGTAPIPNAYPSLARELRRLLCCQHQQLQLHPPHFHPHFPHTCCLGAVSGNSPAASMSSSSSVGGERGSIGLGSTTTREALETVGISDMKRRACNAR